MKTVSISNPTLPSFFDDTFLRDAFFNHRLDSVRSLSSLLSDKERNIRANLLSNVSPFILKGEKEYVLEIPVPGFSKKEISLEVEEGTLHLKAQRIENDYGTKRNVYKEFSFALPQNAEHSKVKANYENGLLKISIEKKERSKPVSIPINSPQNVQVKGNLWDRFIGRIRKIVTF